MPNYVVKSGDTLSGIAQANGLGSNWKALGYTGNPNTLSVGTKLSWGNNSGIASPSTSPISSSTPSATPSGGEYSGLDTFLGDFSTGQRALLDRLNTEQQSGLNAYASKVNSQEKLSDAYSRLSDETGLTTASAKVGALKDKLNTLNADVTARTNGTFTTEGQREGTVNAEAAPLNKDLNTFSYAKAAAQEQVGNRINFLSQDQQKELDPLKMQMTAFQDKAARELTGFTAEHTNQLNLLLSKLQRGQQLSDREWQMTQTLAQQERDFEHQKSLLGIQNENAQKIAGIGSGTTIKTTQMNIDANKELAKIQNSLPPEIAAYIASKSGGGSSTPTFNPTDQKTWFQDIPLTVNK